MGLPRFRPETALLTTGRVRRAYLGLVPMPALFGDAIGVSLPLTVLRNGAMVDVVAMSTEL